MVRLDRNARRLTADEQSLAYSVFKDSLPGWWRIQICDGLGLYDHPYTLEDWPMYLLHVGPTAYADYHMGIAIY